MNNTFGNLMLTNVKCAGLPKVFLYDVEHNRFIKKIIEFNFGYLTKCNMIIKFKNKLRENP